MIRVLVVVSIVLWTVLSMLFGFADEYNAGRECLILALLLLIVLKTRAYE